MERAEEGQVSPASVGQKFLDPATDYAPLMLEMEDIWRRLNDKFLHPHKRSGIAAISSYYVTLAFDLYSVAKRMETEDIQEKAANAARAEKFHL